MIRYVKGWFVTNREKIAKALIHIAKLVPGIAVILLLLVSILLFLFSPTLFLIWNSILTLYQLYLSFNIGWYSHVGYRKVEKFEKMNWKEEYISNRTPLSMNWDEILIYVIIPNYKEDINILRDTLNALRVSSVAKSHLVPVLAMEEREDGHEDKANRLISEYKTNFRDMVFTAHPPDIKGERPGKSSNENWAARELQKHIDTNDLDEDCILITIADADSVIHEKYFPCVLSKFCISPERYRTTWQAPMINFLNLWKIPVFSRLMSYTVTAEFMSNLANPNTENVPFSTYTMSYKTAKEVNYWDPEVCAEDWHMYAKTCFYLGDDYKCDPVFLPVHCYSVGEADTYWKGVKDRFNQGMRHMIAIHEIVYVLREYVKKVFLDSGSPISFKKWGRILYMIIYPFLYGAFGIIIFIVNVPFLSLCNLYLYFYPESLAAQAYVNTPWYYILQFLNACCGICGLSMLYFCAKLLTKQDERKMLGFAFYRKRMGIFLQLCLEFAIILPFTVAVYVFIPTVWNSLKTMWTMEFVYVTATKAVDEKDEETENIEKTGVYQKDVKV